MLPFRFWKRRRTVDYPLKQLSHGRCEGRLLHPSSAAGNKSSQAASSDGMYVRSMYVTVVLLQQLVVTLEQMGNANPPEAMNFIIQ
ncbi:hypothetical protein Efla_001378 [Eimeria flavescens]